MRRQVWIVGSQTLLKWCNREYLAVFGSNLVRLCKSVHRVGQKRALGSLTAKWSDTCSSGGMSNSHWLVATDLDGTLLDDSYPEQQAISVVEQLLDRHGVAVALASSKTLAELLHMVRELDRDGPLPFLVFENGGGWAWPTNNFPDSGTESIEGYQIEYAGTPYSEICAALCDLKQKGFLFRGFADMDEEEVSERTGLSDSQATPS